MPSPVFLTSTLKSLVIGTKLAFNAVSDITTTVYWLSVEIVSFALFVQPTNSKQGAGIAVTRTSSPAVKRSTNSGEVLTLPLSSEVTFNL